MIRALDPDLESHFGDSGSGFRFSKVRNHNIERGVMILALDQESDFRPFGGFES